MKSYTTLLFEEVLTPFYIFQFLAIVLWCFEAYYYYAGCIALVSFISIVVSLIDTHRNAVTLRNMVDDVSMVRRIDALNSQHHSVVRNPSPPPCVRLSRWLSRRCLPRTWCQVTSSSWKRGCKCHAMRYSLKAVLSSTKAC